ncbi:hypothetical protein C5Z25_10775 [Lactobacillus sp. CBA3605]|uniref:hypothetical protein n=1 Tax=Lactobacillus sp. CBA3605 TaxID=2099788 RepID=UPI000CFC12A9|nr:hypothetical protein [Lactobacillus sp. CBA3605]AVK62226.1 hypothetical protein C5Z25_10775 [Lactobacillus sp. CBA3605]
MKTRRLITLVLIMGIGGSLAFAPATTIDAARRPAPRTLMRLRLKLKRPAKHRSTTKKKIGTKHHVPVHHRR